MTTPTPHFLAIRRRFILGLLILSQALPLSAVGAQTKLPDHPRLLFPKSAEAQVKQQIQSDPLAKDLYQELLRRADHAITLPALTVVVVIK